MARYDEKAKIPERVDERLLVFLDKLVPGIAAYLIRPVVEPKA
jgi:hypothetical protein